MSTDRARSFSFQVWRLIQGLYWLALGAWFGALVMLAIAATAAFGAVAEHQPLLPTALPNALATANDTRPSLDNTLESTLAGLGGTHTSHNAVSILAGAIVGRMIDRLRILQWILALVVVTAMTLQHTVFASHLPGHGLAQWMNTLRVMLVVVPVLILAADTVVVGPQIKTQKSIRNDATQPLETLEAANAAFGRLHQISERLLKVQIVMLGTAVLASGFALHAVHDREHPAP